ncbi:hypothetical protein LH392_09635 [Corynebacterium uberis]|uniref:hypothetical protein n=1 Tax=Corynebacterium TaxID=1716 RepID=UPI001D09C93E|nr:MULTISPECIES: hypothetical protein [Corynebacterium]MCZ9310225.1 hypothetical protein [Corynebacterium sp. c6VSa_13]UDL73700.1 hypothetical protein LH391_00185 [Corynebacterium uberis]UDL75418.1 hypothetical protein LH393_09220 [Corynebacterium uberis]UDL77631.1 hypothetical protein LH394_09205 [Corynebacterium uberis]UDL79916.1 hypothetical protein LH392_09635 [Corynebacterium uberis]
MSDSDFWVEHNGPGQGQDSGSPGWGQQVEPEPQRKNWTGVVAAVIGIIVVAALIAASWYWVLHKDPEPTAAPVETTEQSAPTASPAASQSEQPPAQAQADVCSLDYLHRSPGTEKLNLVMYCDGAWMQSGLAYSGDIRIYHLVDGAWQEYSRHGVTDTGWGCMDTAQMDRDGVPEQVRKKVVRCDKSPTPTPTPRTHTSPDAPPLVSKSAGYPLFLNHSGWEGTPDAQCNSIDTWVFAGKSPRTDLVICENPDNGRYYYRGLRDGMGFEADVDMSTANPDHGYFRVPANPNTILVDGYTLRVLDGAGATVVNEEFTSAYINEDLLR